MVVIGRSLNDIVQIGNNIIIKILRIGPNRVTLGIDAPKAVPLHRGVHQSNLDPPPTNTDGKLNVLVIENTPIHAWLIEKSFNAYGSFRTEVVGSGQEAKCRLGLADECAGPTDYHLIVMELQLPDMSGLNLLRAIRSVDRLKIVPIVVLTDADADSNVIRCLEAGANAFLPKPETQEGFRQTLLRIADFWSHASRMLVPATTLVRMESMVV